MRDARIDRRLFLRGVGGATAGLAAATALSACGTGTSRSASTGTGGKDSKTVVVRDSGGSFGAALQKAVYTPFTRETGIGVKVLNLDDAPLLAQIKQGRPQCDLINNSMMSHHKYVKQDALEALDLDRLKSLKSAKIPQNQITEHAVGFSFYGQCIAYRTDAFGGRKPQSWADFWDTKAFKGGRAMVSPDGDLPELEFALLADGVPMDKLYPLDVDRAFKVMTRLRADIKKFWDSGPLPGVLLSRQEVTMSTVWDGRIADLQKQGVPVERQLNGMRRQFSGYAVAKGAANADNAYRLMDFALRAESQADLARAFSSNPSSPLAYEQLSEEERNALSGAPKYYDQGFDTDIDWWLKNEAAVTKRWLEWARG
ncbi:ABC transporter substrate-binding protein [Streptomyces europaeiscabiei]|uniref:ABC transporter substrate-binding protein n=1 Tax=Streptomyces europaeiscabiei TaxID=146819 RepID=A0ABU4NQC2_9ACTN|nr:ABC transporter substrate-binding protein [Streptomyces europaeiscabiei]MDX3547673.1 ABC transporter substrate-binding protein [Streptomyces europaeiscabiei]MDX3557150.1 ABC transporter substrate-binding protein [Streptomyces europaeiscabiei]MDX3666084.1 ABC transporter substrate-binding protein [Streptomyces europaeiscabiei]MDX3704857.1 ABC transporter substrate-binding protein [Streptomyces europaeiscabiei]MDX3714067.1 ABC transporter substrate-binding protein [Streptomyces europaeiscabie